MKESSLVSILIPNFNKANYLRFTLDSVIGQTYSNWECIIVDDFSTDDSWKILEEYSGRDQRFKIYRRPKNRKQGGNAARNFAFEKSVGEYIQWLDSDDLIHPEKLEIQLNDLKGKSSKIISLSNWRGFSGNIVPSNNINKDLRWSDYSNRGDEFLLNLWEREQFVPPHAYLMHRGVLEVSGLWDEDLIQNQDGEFMTRVLLKSDEIIFNQGITAFYRLPDLSHLSKQISKKSWDDWLYSLNLCDRWMLDYNNTKRAKKILCLNYERLIKLIILDYPEIAQKAINRILILNPFVRFSFFKPQVIWLGSWLGISNFLTLRKLLKAQRT
ncbi:Glycosyl transferase family 2 [Algoriphagus ornithinivorans]|uniref:Glycosyl transferase family 2 n=1 Tax=Algoriphagus ornithinivorans TaxID=226506 RepID=A0A1I5HI30_9BACT|nr:glycosyltransferase family 2 protein [Algoriphagus ornithinivorans]SFO47954.1 Glycosyl transferase family 2 [Algoriphagus ornithinivorans]